jgi:Putative amidoligase enzyme
MTGVPDSVTPKIAKPPRATNHTGALRRVGVELEFAAVTARDAAALVQKTFGGTIEAVDAHRFDITGTELGDFRSELDSQFLHRAEADAPEPSGLQMLLANFQDAFQGVLGDIGSAIIPCEIVCPPIEIGDVPRLDSLLAELRRVGAHGTDMSPLYAFGAQLNPDIAEKSAEWIGSVLKAYLLASDWLRAIIAVNLTRRVLAFADPFPPDYVLRVIDPDYRPDMDTLIDDYLIYNPTRNRELDMLPLFAWIDEDRVRTAIVDKRIKTRPTFHYRLPDARIDRPDWTVTTEWNRWCVVERLAEQPDTLAAMARAYAENQERLIPRDWAIISSEWIALS